MVIVEQNNLQSVQQMQKQKPLIVKYLKIFCRIDFVYPDHYDQTGPDYWGRNPGHGDWLSMATWCIDNYEHHKNSVPLKAD